MPLGFDPLDDGVAPAGDLGVLELDVVQFVAQALHRLSRVFQLLLHGGQGRISGRHGLAGFHGGGFELGHLGSAVGQLVRPLRAVRHGAFRGGFDGRQLPVEILHLLECGFVGPVCAFFPLPRCLFPHRDLRFFHLPVDAIFPGRFLIGLEALEQ